MKKISVNMPLCLVPPDRERRVFSMQKIIPFLWFDTEAKEAAELYAKAFDGSIDNMISLPGTPSGTVDIVNITLHSQKFQLMSAGPLFRFTPAVSFLVACTTSAEVDRLWAILAKDGKPLMELGTYPFSERYGWTEDRFGVSWQIMHMGDRPVSQRIIPTLMFVGDVCSKAEEAARFYASIFPQSDIGHVLRYEKGEEPDKEGTVKHMGFALCGQEFAAMDSAYAHKFTFNEAISFLVLCETQEEIDQYWMKLSAHPESEQCGWLKDRFGVSWQIAPTAMEEMQKTASKEQLSRLVKAFLPMKKFDIAQLQKAYDG